MGRAARIISSLVCVGTLALLLMNGCRERIDPETPDYVEYGWELLAEGKYRDAIVQFEAGTDMDDSYADTWNGLGWAYARLGAADTSVDNFNEGAALSDTSVVGTEILGGRSFARLALGQFKGAVGDARSALLSTPSWVFRRDPNVTYEHLILTAATGFYAQGKFDSSLIWIRKLDSFFSADTTTIRGRSRLAAKLEALQEDLQ